MQSTPNSSLEYSTQHGLRTPPKRYRNSLNLRSIHRFGMYGTTMSSQNGGHGQKKMVEKHRSKSVTTSYSAYTVRR